jgi:hypothetical protein
VKTRKLLITLLIVVLLVVYYLLGTGYRKQRQEHETLASQVNDATGALAQMPEPPADLELSLATAQASLDTVKNSFPDMMSSTRVVNTILRLADECEVKAIPLITQPWTTGALSDYNYSVFRLNVAVTGTFTQLVDFLTKLENGELKTLIIEGITVTEATEPSGVPGAPDRAIPVKASLDLAIYTRPPASS